VGTQVVPVAVRARVVRVLRPTIRGAQLPRPAAAVTQTSRRSKRFASCITALMNCSA